MLLSLKKKVYNSEKMRKKRDEMIHTKQKKINQFSDPMSTKTPPTPTTTKRVPLLNNNQKNKSKSKKSFIIKQLKMINFGRFLKYTQQQQQQKEKRRQKDRDFLVVVVVN